MSTTLIRSRSRTKSLGNYSELKRRVQETLLLGQQKIEQQKVLTYWETGKLIKQHLLSNKERADYGSKVIARLSRDLDVDISNLWRVLQFANEFPILDARRELTWAHYRALMSIPDAGEKEKLADKASKEKWTSRELVEHVRNLNWSKRIESSGSKAPEPLEPPLLGEFYTYKIIRPETIHSKSSDLLIDLGFSVTIETSRFSDSSFAPDNIITSSKDARGKYALKSLPKAHTTTSSQNANNKSSPNARAEKITKSSRAALETSVSSALVGDPVSQLFTYKAFVERIVDGDTLKVEIDLGFNTRIRQTLRLKYLDAWEMDSPKGKGAKRFVEDQLAGVPFVVLKSHKPDDFDKYRRYLADVFVPGKDFMKDWNRGTAVLSSANDLLYLNNALIQKGHAVKVR